MIPGNITSSLQVLFRRYHTLQWVNACIICLVWQKLIPYRGKLSREKTFPNIYIGEIDDFVEPWRINGAVTTGLSTVY